MVGEEALSADEKLYINFVEKYEKDFVSQGAFANRTIFDSLDLAWSLLRIFPPALLNKIDPKTREAYYPRNGKSGRPPYAENMPEGH